MNNNIQDNQSQIATTSQHIDNKIFTIRGVQVMLDSDLAELYGVETKRINEAVKNNRNKFPEDFYFELTKEDDVLLRSKFSTFNESLKNRKYAPKVFTEQGVYMLATVLKSDIATQVTISIIRAFAQMRKLIHDNILFQEQLKELEKRQLSFEIKTDERLETIFKAIESKSIAPKQGVFFDGQIFDAYALISELVKKAKQSLILIDNYCDESTLTHLSKADAKVKIIILTKTITKQLKLDIQKYNDQYGNLKTVEFISSHDRFLIIDQKEIYHIGASLKDLGKKWFAFSLLEVESFGLMERVRKAVGDE